MDLDELDNVTTCYNRSLQLILDVRSVIKELVENSLDAGATEIEIKLVENGCKLIQVTDNGRGIDEKDFEILALRHTTSKIGAFDDVYSNLSTLGFRGEALNSLANLANLEIETRTADKELGWRLKFDHSGNLLTKENISTKVGTIVRVSELFQSVPVRRNLLWKYPRVHTANATLLLQQYAIAYYTIKFHLLCYNGGCKVANLFSFYGNSRNYKDAAAEIFGRRTLSQTLDINFTTEDWRMSGFISCSTFDRLVREPQFFYVNGRPVNDITSLRKCILDVWKRYSSRNNLIYVIYFETDPRQIDVNLTPDKRDVFLLNEEAVVKLFREELLLLYTPKLNVDALANKIMSQKTYLEQSQPLTNEQLAPKPPNIEKQEQVLMEIDKELDEVVDPTEKDKDAFLDGMVVREGLGLQPLSNGSSSASLEDARSPQMTMEELSYNYRIDTRPKLPPRDLHEITPRGSLYKRKIAQDPAMFSPSRLFKPTKMAVPPAPKQQSLASFLGLSTAAGKTGEQQDDITCADLNVDNYAFDGSTQQGKAANNLGPKPKVHFDSNIVAVDFDALFNHEAPKVLDSEPSPLRIIPPPPELYPVDTDHLDPAIFLKMEVIGQFNNGFIITRLPDESGHSIYIIDQHAANEKARLAPHLHLYKRRFERYNKEVTMLRQPLVKPLRMDLSPFHRQIVEDNIDILGENGFSVIVRRQGGVEIFLETVGRLMGHTLTVEDFVSFVHELANSKSGVNDGVTKASVIWGNSMVVPRPRKIWDILASRACKNSIKLGDPLSMLQMQQIVAKLATLIHPWNCPHGRPTLKCLITSDQLSTTH